jgi:dihydrofolate synthase/folylpolyglutamate synthase
VLDVAHNPQAARILAAALSDMGYHPDTHAVFGMLADKDVRGVIDAVRGRVDRWHVATLPEPRGAAAATLVGELASAGIDGASVRTYASIDDAYRGARDAAGEADRIAVFGSFLTVAAALEAARSTAISAHRPSHG